MSEWQDMQQKSNSKLRDFLKTNPAKTRKLSELSKIKQNRLTKLNGMLSADRNFRQHFCSLWHCIYHPTYHKIQYRRLRYKTEYYNRDQVLRGFDKVLITGKGQYITLEWYQRAESIKPIFTDLQRYPDSLYTFLYTNKTLIPPRKPLMGGLNIQPPHPLSGMLSCYSTNPHT